ncbi:MAG TPA: glycosyltransferase, partial [Alphaproteobacteria bacterium]|nr:glycosyltransferase [Alphaproteobacteria bacterium]
IRLIIHEQNKGFPSALNTMIENAQGDLIAIFDDDDESHTDRIRKQCEAIEHYESNTKAELVACYASLQKKYPNQYAVDFPAIGSRQKNPIGDDIVRYHLYLERDPDVFYGGGTPSCALMTRKSTFRTIGLYDPKLRRNEDCDFAVRLGLHGGHIIGTKDFILTQYASLGADKKPHIARDSELAFITKYKNILDRYNRYEYAKDWINVRYYHFAGKKALAIAQIVKMTAKYPILTVKRFFKAAPKRLLHEWKMQKDAG